MELYCKDNRLVREIKMLSLGSATIPSFQKSQDSIYYEIGEAYQIKKWDKVIEISDELLNETSNCIGYLKEYIQYMKLQAIYNKGDFNSEDFYECIQKSPPKFKDYFLGLYFYRIQNYNLAYKHFSASKYSLYAFVNESWDFLETSIRGINSAINFDELEYLFEIFPSVPENFFDFKVIKKSSSFAKVAHIIACDSTYFVKFFDSFYDSFISLNLNIDLWCHITNPNSEVIKILNLPKYDKVNFSEDSINYKNIKTYYTETRFIASYFIYKIHNYKKMIYSDIDVKFNHKYHEHFLNYDYDLSIKY